MVGFSHRVQIRHVVVAKSDVAELIKTTLEEIKESTGRVKRLMSLAEKYSLCESKTDGGNLGWLEIANDEPRIRDLPSVLKNAELEQNLRDAFKTRMFGKGSVMGPYSTAQGYHVVVIANEFGENAV